MSKMLLTEIAGVLQFQAHAIVAELLAKIPGSSETTLLLSQVQLALQAVAQVEDMCLPRVETLELYFYLSRPRSLPDSHLACRLHVMGVFEEIGNMVAIGLLPSLKQVEPTTQCIKTCYGASRTED